MGQVAGFVATREATEFRSEARKNTNIFRIIATWLKDLEGSSRDDATAQS